MASSVPSGVNPNRTSHLVSRPPTIRPSANRECGAWQTADPLRNERRHRMLHGSQRAIDIPGADAIVCHRSDASIVTA